ncbi:perlucin-like protein [Mytilus edulis]|uniref:perlucin-like protein n=1 Tax=Mytilus edulis TaxID=6550 RepID=UPI0039F0D3D8
MMNMMLFVLVVFICEGVLSFPSRVVNQDFNKSRNALIALKMNLSETVDTLETDVKNTLTTLKSNMKDVDGKILQLVENDFKARQWEKHNGHCYYFGTERVNWFTSERKCREIGGYIVKIDDSSENSWVATKRPDKNTHYWIGLTDVVEGQFRWSYDQSPMTYKKWYSGWGSKGTGHNCVMYSYPNDKWLDYTCMSPCFYICESNFCY